MMIGRAVHTHHEMVRHIHLALRQKLDFTLVDLPIDSWAYFTRPPTQTLIGSSQRFNRSVAPC